MYNQVHAFTSELTNSKAYARTTSRVKAMSSELSMVVVTMNLPRRPLAAHWPGAHSKVLICQR